MIIDTVYDRFFFLSERTEDLIPNDQEFAEILIKVGKINPMMNAMVRRSGEIFLEPAELSDPFRMMQKRDEKMNAAHHINMQRVKPDQRQRPKEQE